MVKVSRIPHKKTDPHEAEGGQPMAADLTASQHTQRRANPLDTHDLEIQRLISQNNQKGLVICQLRLHSLPKVLPSLLYFQSGLVRIAEENPAKI